MTATTYCGALGRGTYGAGAGDHTYLDQRFFAEARRAFDRGARRVAGDREKTERLDHARLALDRATLARWPVACGERCAADDFDRVAQEYRETWANELARRDPSGDLEAALVEVDREIEFWRARGLPVLAATPPDELR